MTELADFMVYAQRVAEQLVGFQVVTTRDIKFNDVTNNPRNTTMLVKGSVGTLVSPVLTFGKDPSKERFYNVKFDQYEAPIKLGQDDIKNREVQISPN